MIYNKGKFYIERIKVHYIIVSEARLKGNGDKKLKDVENVFRKAGIQYEIIRTRDKGDAKAATERITLQSGDNAIITMGGDGTLHDIINGFKSFENCSLGLIPFGTGNDFAATAGIPKNHKKAAEIIAYSKPRNIDFIELSSGLRSINSVGMGIDVDVLQRTYAANKKGKGKYLRSLISSLIHFKSCNFTVEYDGKEEKHFGLIAALGNGKQFGGGIKLFPEAKLDDGYLDLFMVDYISKPKMIGAFLKLMRGKVNKIKNVTIVKTKAARFYNESENYYIQAEGELYKNVAIDAHIVEGKLRFYLPTD